MNSRRCILASDSLAGEWKSPRSRFPPSFFSRHHPFFVEMRMLDCFAFGLPAGIFFHLLAIEMIAVGGVQRAIARLNDGWVMESAGFRAGRVKFQMPFPLP